MTREALYLSWVNDFLTVSVFAHYYGMTEADAASLIDTERTKAWSS